MEFTEKTVIVIPAIAQRQERGPGREDGKRRVAAYARVSTNREEQQNLPECFRTRALRVHPQRNAKASTPCSQKPWTAKPT